MLVFFLVQVIPQFKGLFADSGRDPGALVRAILAMSDVLVDNETGFAVGLALALLAGLLVYSAYRQHILLHQGLIRKHRT